MRLVRSLDDLPTRAETMIERRILETVGGGCVVPVAIHAHMNNGEARVVAEVLSIDGTKFVRIDEVIPADDLERATELGRRLLGTGGRTLVDEAVKAVGKR